MATVINAGRVAMVPKGEWASATAYTRLDVVLYNGSSWVAIADSTGQVPAEGSTYWQLLASGVDPSNYYTKTETNTKLEKKANLTSLYRFTGFSIIADGSPEDAATAFGPYVDVLSSKLDTYCPGWGDVADHRSILQLIRLNNAGSYNSGYLFTGAFGDGLRRAASEAHEMGFNSLIFPADLVVHEAGVDMLEERIDAVERDKADKTLMASTIPSTGLLPNVVYNYGTTDTVSVTLAAGDAGVANIWCFVFTAQTAACTVTLPSSVVLGNEYAWDMVAGRRYEVSIMDNVAIVNYVD